ncbi:MAG: ammonium transporter [Chthoniobacter sp.]|uniref:ammonium transporter n=1 Tax=Chthoniobacter sp. TaxID=2510640 RepID=UPI0032AAE86D
MKLRQRMALLAATAGALGWMVLGAPSVQAQDKPPEAPPAAAPAPAAEAPKDAAPAAAAPADAAAAPAAKTDTPDSTGTTANTDKINGGNAGTAMDLQWPIPADTSTINPDGKGKVTPDEVIANVAHNKISLNLMWTLVTGFLVMFMQAGFALVETGLCRAKNAAHVMATNFMIYGLGMLGFWVCGFAFMFGNYWNGPVGIGWQPPLGQGLANLDGGITWTIFGKPFGIIGTKGFCLGPSVFDTAVFTLFLFEMVFMDTTATIPTGAMAERWNFKHFIVYGFWVGMFPYAIYGNWVWGGGWLAQLGQNFALGHGAVDFAGSGVVHMCGGVIGLAGSICIGARLGKFGKDGKARPMPGHDIPMVMLGTFILAFGWFGFNPGSTLAGTDSRIAVIAVNTMLAGAAASVGALLTMYLVTGKPDPSMLCNGLLAGLVAITAPCAFVSSLGAVILGFIAGIIVVFSVFFWEKRGIDDPVGAISVHGVCGCWGVLSVGIFANGSYGAGWGGVHKLFKDGAFQIVNTNADGMLKTYNDLVSKGWADQGVTGIFGTFFGAPAGDGAQLMAQIVDVSALFIFIFIFSFAFFKISNLIVPIRSKREDEIMGLDIPEMGAEAYPDFQLTDRTSPKVD